MLQSITVPIHRDGWKFIAIFAGLSLLLSYLSSDLGWLGVLLTGWCVYFFRDPVRVTPLKPGAVISPADGIVSNICQATPPAELGLSGDDWTRISIFLNVFDVHVNRIPIDGTIIKTVYHPGKFLNASLDKASEHNERQAIALQTDDHKTIAFVQIAGLIARRIVCQVQENQNVKAGARYGLIRFGSRADVYLPHGVSPLVVKGQRMIGGETILADLNCHEQQRTGHSH